MGVDWLQLRENRRYLLQVSHSESPSVTSSTVGMIRIWCRQVHEMCVRVVQFAAAVDQYFLGAVMH